MTSLVRLVGPLASAVSLAVACAADPIPPASPAPPPASSAVPIASVPPTPPASPAPAARASATPPASTKAPDTRAWDSWPKSWSDPRVVAVLADHCDFVPVAPTSSESEPFGDEDVLACRLPFQQACFTTPCSDESEACKGECEAGCSSCGKTCATQCGACEAACTDAACRTACATTTATCKETCARAMDRCASGTCAKAAITCNEAESHAANRCEARCESFRGCIRKCGFLPDGGPNVPCDTSCETALESRYAPCTRACEAAGGSPLVKARCSRTCSERFPCNARTCATP